MSKTRTTKNRRRNEVSLKYILAHGSVLKMLTMSLMTAASLLALCSYVVAQNPNITFRVNQLNHRVPPHGPINTIGVDPANERNVLVASDTGGLFRSSDGVNWQHEDSLPSNNTVDIAYLRRGGVIVSTADGFEARGGGVWIQRGANWTNLAREHSLFPAPGARCPATPGAYDIDLDPVTGRIYVATDCGVAIGSPDAETWEHVEIAGASSFKSITVLGGGHLIVGGEAGVWYSRNGGTSWSRETSLINGVSSIHGLTRDPRGGDRAYAVNDSRQLYQTINGGATWSQITANPERGDCGGIAFVKAVRDRSRVRLYFGNRCNTWTTSFDALSEPMSAPPNWMVLRVDHDLSPDTRDLAFHPGTANPYLMSSDKGLDTTTDGTNFTWIGAETGLNANQITEIRGQYVGTGSTPDMYYATWHNGVIAAGGSRTAGACPEGWGLGVLRRIPRAADSTISVSCPGQNLLADRLFLNLSQWSDPAQGGLRPPVILRQGTYVQGTEPTADYPLRPRGLQYTTNTGGNWRQIVEIRQPLNDLAKPAGLASDPTLIQSVQMGMMRNGQQEVGLVRVSGFSSGAAATLEYPSMDGFGTIAVFPTQIWYEVYAVDPNDATHMIAADGLTNDVKVTTNGGDLWDPIPGLTDLVSHRGEYRMGKPWGNRVASLVSAISFCPDNSNRVLMGTQQGGVYFSYNSGQTWMPVTGSEAIVPTSSFFWLNNCGTAWASTWGRGIWQIDMAVSYPFDWSELRRCRPCPFDKLNREDLFDDFPDPKSIQALFVLDGEITAINESGGTSIITVSQGSVLARHGKLSKVRVVFQKDTQAADSSLSKQNVIQGVVFKGKKMSVITGASRLDLYSRVAGKKGPGKGQVPASQKSSMEVISTTSSFGTAAVMTGEPLVIQVNNLESVENQTFMIQIDGKEVAKIETSQKSFEYVDKLTQWSKGRHVVALVSAGPTGPQTVWVTNFLVPYGNEYLESTVRPSQPLAKELLVTGTSFSSTPETYQGQCPVTINFSGKITVNGKGTVQYKFLRSDGAVSPVQVLEFDSAGSRTVSTVWSLGGPSLIAYDGWQAIQIVSPNIMDSGKALFAFRCDKSKNP